MMKRQLIVSAAAFLCPIHPSDETYGCPGDSWVDARRLLRRDFFMARRILASPLGGDGVQVFWVSILAAVTTWFLLRAAAKLCGRGLALWRSVIGAMLFGGLTALTMLVEIPFLDSFWWRLIMLQSTAWLAYGFSLHGGLLFTVLHLSLSSVTASASGYVSAFLGSVGICLACLAAEHKYKLIPVSFLTKDGRFSILALRDTGNTLTDPITGRSVLVVDAEVSRQLTDLTAQDLRDPIVTLQTHPELRLIPYRTIDSTGFLLARRFQNVTIGTKKGSVLVAFSPQKFANKYQALTGGDLW